MKKIFFIFAFTVSTVCICNNKKIDELNKSSLIPFAYQEQDKKWMILLSSIANKNYYDLPALYTKQSAKGFKKTADHFSQKVGDIYTVKDLIDTFNHQKEKRSNLEPLVINTDHNEHKYFPVSITYKTPEDILENSPTHHGKPKTDHQWFPLRKLISALKRNEESLTLDDQEFYIAPQVKEVLTNAELALPRRDKS